MAAQRLDGITKPYSAQEGRGAGLDGSEPDGGDRDLSRLDDQRNLA